MEKCKRNRSIAKARLETCPRDFQANFKFDFLRKTKPRVCGKVRNITKL